jgi:predicted peptidase
MNTSTPRPEKKKRAAITCLALSALSVLASAETSQTAQSFASEVTLKVGYEYLLALPEGYAAAPDKRWPLIVFLHGSGERGDNLEAVKKHGPPKLLTEGKALPAIVVSPQCPAQQIWNPYGVKALVDALVKSHRVDTDRIYLTGLSMGGFGTWETAMEYPDTFAALVPICGGTGVRFVMADRIKNIPEWIFHGAKDPVVSPKFSEQMFGLLKKLGTDVQLTIYPEAQHDSWTQAYQTEELWTWLFAQKRTTKP